VILSKTKFGGDLMANGPQGGLSDIFNPGGALTSNLPHSAASLAEILYGRPEAKGLYYNGKTIKLDGYNFSGCRFDNCVLEVTSMNFNLTRCVIDSSTTISYGNTVLKVVQLFNSRYEWAYQNFPPQFVPQRHADGTITISDKAVA
jgi:hypothetical protein